MSSTEIARFSETIINENIETILQKSTTREINQNRIPEKSGNLTDKALAYTRRASRQYSIGRNGLYISY